MKTKMLKLFQYWRKRCPGEIRGCTEEEINRLEKHYAVQLPKAYREYLFLMGKLDGGLFRDSLTAYPYLFEMKKRAMFEIADCDDPVTFKLPEQAFFIYEYPNYQFDYFLVSSDNDDPSVFACEVGDPSPIRQWPSFTNWLDIIIARFLDKEILFPVDEEKWIDEVKPGWDEG